MRLLFHGVYFHPEVGGMESHILHLAEGLVQRGAKITLVASRSVEGTKRHEIYKGLEIFRVPLIFRNPVGWFLYVIFSLPRFILLSSSHDLLHCHSFASAFAGAIAKRRKPLVVTIHTSHFNVLSRKKVLRPFFRIMLNRADHIIAVSNELASIVRSIVPGKPVTRLTNAVDVEMFQMGEEKMFVRQESSAIRLFYSGHLLHKKGVDVLIRALPDLRFNWNLKIVGEGPLRDDLDRLIASLNLLEQVEFVGMKPHDEMPVLIKSADIVIIPSRIEATSIAALEAMACGKVIVASDIGGLPEIVQEGWGYLFKAGDAKELARVLNKACEERERFPDMGMKGSEFVRKHYSTKTHCDFHEELYHGLIERHSTKGTA